MENLDTGNTGYTRQKHREPRLLYSFRIRSFFNSSSYQMSSGRHAFQTCICSLIEFNSYLVLYLMCCFGNTPLHMDLKPIKILFCCALFCSTKWCKKCLEITQRGNQKPQTEEKRNGQTKQDNRAKNDLQNIIHRQLKIEQHESN